MALMEAANELKELRKRYLFGSTHRRHFDFVSKVIFKGLFEFCILRVDF